jgi:hypothetical protein
MLLSCFLTTNEDDEGYFRLLVARVERIANPL